MNRYIIISLFILFVLPVLGQNDSVWKHDLKEITITAERLETYNTGNRTEKPDSLLQQFFRSSPLSALLDASGGMVMRSYGPGILATSSLRGGNAQQTVLTWNGISINSQVYGQTDFNLIPSFLFDGVSVLPGIAGSLQGSGAISGGVNLNNNRPVQKGLSLELLQTVGSFGTFTSGLKLHYSGNKWSNATKVFYSKTDNNYPFINYTEAENPKEKLTNAKGNIVSVLHETGYKSLKTGTLKLSYWGTFAERLIPPTLLMESSVAKQFDDIHKTMLQWDRSFKKVNFKFRSLWQNEYLKYTDPGSDINSISNSVVFTNDAEFQFKLFKLSSTSAGAVQTMSKAKVENILINEITTNNRSDRMQVAFWASHFQQIPLIRTSISAGIRQEIVDAEPLPFIPSLGFKTNLHKNWDFYGQTGRVYRIPTLNDLHWVPGGNPELKPESGWASELSLEFHKKNQRTDFTTSVTAFSRLITNWIQWQPVSSQLWSPVNIGKVNSRGIELRSILKLIFTEKLYGKAGFGFDHTRSENMDAENPNYKKQLLYIPFFKSSGFIGVGYHKTLLLIQGIWVDKRFVSSDNRDEIPAYGLINAAINQSLKFKNSGADIFIRVNNILNKQYEAIAWRPMPGINYEVGVKIVCTAD